MNTSVLLCFFCFTLQTSYRHLLYEVNTYASKIQFIS